MCQGKVSKETVKGAFGVFLNVSGLSLRVFWALEGRALGRQGNLTFIKLQ